MPSLETPPNPTPPEVPTRPAPPTKLRSGRYGELDDHELLHLLDSLDDEREKSRFRESIYISFIVYIALAWFVLYGPRVLFHQGKIISPADVLKQRDKELTLPRDAQRCLEAHPRPRPPRPSPIRPTAPRAPNPTLDKKTLEQLQAMRRAGTPGAAAPSPLPPTPQPQAARSAAAATRPPARSRARASPDPTPTPQPKQPQISSIPDAPHPRPDHHPAQLLYPHHPRPEHRRRRQRRRPQPWRRRRLRTERPTRPPGRTGRHRGPLRHPGRRLRTLHPPSPHHPAQLWYPLIPKRPGPR